MAAAALIVAGDSIAVAIAFYPQPMGNRECKNLLYKAYTIKRNVKEGNLGLRCMNNFTFL